MLSEKIKELKKFKIIPEQAVQQFTCTDCSKSLKTNGALKARITNKHKMLSEEVHDPALELSEEEKTRLDVEEFPAASFSFSASV